jgi:hypothetical protein
MVPFAAAGLDLYNAGPQQGIGVCDKATNRIADRQTYANNMTKMCGIDRRRT